MYSLGQNADVAVLLQDCMHLGLGPVESPMPNRHALEQDIELASAAEQKWSRSRHMSVSFFAISSRFDVSQTVSRLAQKMAHPTVSTTAGLKRQIVYLVYKPTFTLIVCRANRTDNGYGFYVDSEHGDDQPYSSRSQTSVLLEVDGLQFGGAINNQ